MADSVETLGVDMRTRVKRTRKKRRVRISLIKKHKAFHRSHRNVGVRKL